MLKNVSAEINQMVQLEELYLWNNNIGQLPVEITYLPALRILHVHDNPLFELPKELGRMNISLFINKRGVNEAGQAVLKALREAGGWVEDMTYG